MIVSSRRWVSRFLLMMAAAASIYPAHRRLQEVLQLSGGTANASTDDYWIGAEDLLENSVFEAPGLDRTVRVWASGQISLPPVGSSQAAGFDFPRVGGRYPRTSAAKLHEGSPRRRVHGLRHISLVSNGAKLRSAESVMRREIWVS